MYGEGAQIALEQEEIKIDGKYSIYPKESKSPSDIIWLNRGVTRISQIKRGVMVITIIMIVTVILILMFLAEVQS